MEIENMGNIMKNPPPVESEEESGQIRPGVQGGYTSASDMLKGATGLDIDLSQVGATMDRPRAAVPIEGLKPEGLPDPVSVPNKNPGVAEPGFIPPGMQIIGEEEAKNLGINGPGERIDYMKEAEREDREKFDAAQRDKQKDMEAMFAEALQSEEERFQRQENTYNADEETKERILGKAATTATATTVTYKERQTDDRNNSADDYDPAEFMPSYSNEDDKENPDAKAAEDDVSEDEVGGIVRELKVATVETPEHLAVIPIKSPTVSTIPRTDHRNQPVGDQAFDNAIARFKKDNFGKVTVPLVNSGFMCDIVGTGVVDLQNMYVNISRDTTVYDYQLEQMRTVIRSVVGTNPKIDPISLQGMIHYQDFQMMSFGLVCATLETVESVTNCTECGKQFRITAKPYELLMNMDELYERTEQIRSAPNVETYSLMNSYKEITSSTGIVVTLGHPSYANEVSIIKSFLAYSKNMTAEDAYRFRSMLRLLYMVRKVRLPSGIVSNNLFQHFRGLMLLRSEDLDLVSKTVTDMRKDMLIPKFGIHKVICPHCGNVLTDISFDNLMELVFLDTTVKGYLNNPEA